MQHVLADPRDPVAHHPERAPELQARLNAGLRAVLARRRRKLRNVDFVEAQASSRRLGAYRLYDRDAVGLQSGVNVGIHRFVCGDDQQPLSTRSPDV